MANRPFTRGVQEVGNGLYAYVQPDGTWGLSNAGLIVDGGEALLIDTLITLPLTRQMLDDFKAKVPGSDRIGRLVNTHANPDHFFGNQLIEGAEIIATERTAQDMGHYDPTMLQTLPDTWRERGDAGEFLYEMMGSRFDFSGIVVAPPTETFVARRTLHVGGKRVELVDLGPAHTASDIIAHLPDERVVFTGDLLFNEGTPIMWAGPIENWIAACDHIAGLDVEVVIPGHGPVTDKSAVAGLRSYFVHVRDEARVRFDAGVGWEEAARDINLREFRGWSDPERIVANVFSLYRQWGMQPTAQESAGLFGAMGRYHKAMASHGAECGHAH